MVNHGGKMEILVEADNIHLIYKKAAMTDLGRIRT